MPQWITLHICFILVEVPKSIIAPLCNCWDKGQICISLCCCSVDQSCSTLCHPLNHSTPGFLVLHDLLVFAQTHVCWVNDAIILSSHSLSPPSPPALNLSQHQGLFQWVGSLHQVTKDLELQHQSLQWLFRVAFFSDWLVWSSCCPRDSQESSPQHHSLKASIL